MKNVPKKRHSVMAPLTSNIESEIGRKISQIRRENRITLETVSKLTGFSKGYLSKVEKAEKAPPVSTLVKIARALGVTISSFLGEDSQKISFAFTPRDNKTVRTVPDFGYTYEVIAPKYPNKLMDVFLVTFSNKQVTQKVFQHDGEELFFLLEGKINFTYENQSCILEAGDSIYFDSGKPHMVESIGPVDARCLLVFCNPAGRDKE